MQKYQVIIHSISIYSHHSAAHQRSPGPAPENIGPAPASPGTTRHRPPASAQRRTTVRPGGGGTRPGTRGAESWLGLRRSAVGNVFKPHLGDITSHGDNFLRLQSQLTDKEPG